MLILVPLLPLAIFAFIALQDTVVGAHIIEIEMHGYGGNPRENNWRWIAETPLHYAPLTASRKELIASFANAPGPRIVRVDSVLAVGKEAAPAPTVQDESPSNATWTDFSATA